MTESHRIPGQSETRDGVTMTTHRYAEKRLVTRGIPDANGVGVQYAVEATDVHQLRIDLKDGASVLLEPGALQYSHGRIANEVVRHEPGKGMLGRMMSSAGTGESAYATRFTGDGVVWCEPGRRHFVLLTMDGDEDAMLLDDEAFYACSSGVRLETHRHTTASGALSGNGLLQPKVVGRGVVAVTSPVPVEEIDVIEVRKGEEAVVDGDFMLMYSARLKVEIGPLVRGVRDALRSGEGLVYKFTGEGQVFVTPTSRIA